MLRYAIYTWKPPRFSRLTTLRLLGCDVDPPEHETSHGSKVHAPQRDRTRTTFFALLSHAQAEALQKQSWVRAVTAQRLRLGWTASELPPEECLLEKLDRNVIDKVRAAGHTYQRSPERSIACAVDVFDICLTSDQRGYLEDLGFCVWEGLSACSWLSADEIAHLSHQDFVLRIRDASPPGERQDARVPTGYDFDKMSEDLRMVVQRVADPDACDITCFVSWNSDLSQNEIAFLGRYNIHPVRGEAGQNVSLSARQIEVLSNHSAVGRIFAIVQAAPGPRHCG
jgi:hypothetical protein